MKVKKPIKRAQDGLPPKDLFDKNYDTLKTASKQIKGIKTDKPAPLSLREQRIKEGYFREDPKSGDLIPTAKYFADRAAGKKVPVSKNGGKVAKKGVVKKVVKAVKKVVKKSSKKK